VSSERNGQNIPAAEVLQQLDRLLGSDNFRNAGRLSRFLRFAVERTLKGEGDQLKEYVLGVEVFDRTGDYDPRLDPVVRVEARRLRAKLLEYYGGAGRNDPVHIALPKGSYVPEFGRPDKPNPSPRRMVITAFGVALITLLGAWLALRPSAVSLTVAVLPMRAFSADASADPELNAIADSLAESVIISLSRDRRIRVLAWPAAATVRLEGPLMGEAGRRLHARAIAGVFVTREGGHLRISSHMLDAARRSKLWADSWDKPEGAWPEFREELSRRIADGICERLPR